jgi:hypothetical protein
MERLGSHARSSVLFHNPAATRMMDEKAQVDWSVIQELLSRVCPVPTGVSGSKAASWNWDDLLDRLALTRRVPGRVLRAEAGTIRLQTHDPDNDLDSGGLAVALLD